MTNTAANLEQLKRDFFLPYQWAWITDEAPMKLYPKSRRIGITFATSYRVVRKCLRRKNHTQWVSSKDLLLAREFITDYVRKWCRLANVVASGLEGEKLEVIDTEKDITAYVVRFPNGSRIVSLSSNPNAFAGKGGDVLLDEVDLHEDSGTLIDMSTPCTMWGGQLEIVSAYAADGSNETPFAKLCEEVEEYGNPMGWSYHKTDIDDAIAAGLVDKINAVRQSKNPEAPTLTPDQFRAECRGKCRTDAAWLSQYKCQPCDVVGEKLVRPTDLLAAKQNYPIMRRHLEGDAGPGEELDACVRDLVGELTRESLDLTGRRQVIGYDVARTTDLASVWVDDELSDGNYQLVALFTLHNCKFGSQRALVSHLLDILPGSVGAGDSTGNGMQNCEILADAYLDRFQGVNFASEQRELATLMTEIFEHGGQIIPLKPSEISADIACIEKGLTRTKRVTYIEKENRLNVLSHADMAWSCALAKYAGKHIQADGAVFIESAGRRGEDDDDYQRRGLFRDSRNEDDYALAGADQGWGY